MVEVHLDRVFGNFEDYSRDYSAHAVHHRDCVARYKEVFADLSVNLECSFRQVDDSCRIHFAISVGRGEGDLELVTWLHALDVCLELRKEVACSVDIVKRSFLCCMVYYLSFYFEFIAELYYCVLCNFHILCFYIIYAENDTFSKASVPICHLALGL